MQAHPRETNTQENELVEFGSCRNIVQSLSDRIVDPEAFPVAAYVFVLLTSYLTFSPSRIRTTTFIDASSQ